jgi:hypothetical protein
MRSKLSPLGVGLARRARLSCRSVAMIRASIPVGSLLDSRRLAMTGPPTAGGGVAPTPVNDFVLPPGSERDVSTGGLRADPRVPRAREAPPPIRLRSLRDEGERRGGREQRVYSSRSSCCHLCLVGFKASSRAEETSATALEVEGRTRTRNAILNFRSASESREHQFAHAQSMPSTAKLFIDDEQGIPSLEALRGVGADIL